MINEITSFITNHYDELLAIIGGTVSVATIIVKITPTQTDDFILNKIISFLTNFSLIKKNEK